MRESDMPDADAVVPSDSDNEEQLSDGDVEIIEGDSDDGEGASDDDNEPGPADDESETEQLVDDSSAQFLGHQEPVYVIRAGPNDLAVSGGGDDKAFLWNYRTGNTIYEFAGHTDSVTAVGFSFDGKMVATGGLDAQLFIWDTASGQKLTSLEGPTDSIEWVEWHNRGNVILAGAGDGSLWLWSVAGSNYQCLGVMTGHGGPVTCGGFTPDGKGAYSGSADGTVRVWNPKSSKAVAVFEGQQFHEGGVNCLAISQDSPLLISGSEDMTAKLMHMESQKVLLTFGDHSDSVENVAFCPVLPLVATACVDGKLRIFDVHSAQLRLSCVHENAVTKIRFLPNSPLILTGSTDAKLRLWDSRNGLCVKTLRGHVDAIMDFDLTSDASTVLTASDDQMCGVFSLV